MPQSARKTPDTELSQFRVKGEIPVPILINWLTAVAVPLLCFFAWRSSLQNDPITPPLLVGFAVLLAVNSVSYLLFGNKTLQRRGFITLITVLFTYLAINAVEDGSAVIFLFSPLGDFLFDPPHSTSFRITMIAVLGFEMVTCYILDQSRRRSKLGLLKLAAEFEYAAKHDALTGLANRREALEQLDIEYQRYLRNARPFSVLLMDIDLFKSVNDNYGHHVGDELIILVARTLREQCRKVDTLARWGGEEYLVLLPETNTGEALASANRIREAFAARSVSTEKGPIQATISVGVASIRGSESIDRLLQRSDEALYRSNSEGRNRACGYENEAAA